MHRAAPGSRCASRSRDAQCSHTPGVDTRSNGRDRNRYAALVSAPTGQIWMVLPEKYDWNGLSCGDPDLLLRAALQQVDERVAGDLLGEPGAALAQHAALAVQQHLRGDRRSAWERPLRSTNRESVRPVAHRLVLQRALAALVADRAVQRVVDQQQLHHALLRLLRHRRGELGLDDHAVGDRHACSRPAAWASAGRPSPPRPGTAGRRRPGRAAGGRRTAGRRCRAARRCGSAARPWARRPPRRRWSAGRGPRGPGAAPACGFSGGRRHAEAPVSSASWSGCATAGCAATQVQELLAEVLDAAGDRAGRAVTEGAERAAEDVVADVEQRVDVLLRCPRRAPSARGSARSQ